MKVVIAGGGTAGHVFPAIALAQELAAHGHRLGVVVAVHVGDEKAGDVTYREAEGA